jgi:pyruvate carboxylase
VRYHDVTPGSQITWNTAFLGVTGAYKRGGEREVRRLLNILDIVNLAPEAELTAHEREARLDLYCDSNDAFRNLLVGKYGKLPLGFPADWVYQSAFGADWKDAIANRTESSPLESLPDMDIQAEEHALTARLGRKPTPEEFVLYLNHPGDALKTIEFAGLRRQQSAAGRLVRGLERARPCSSRTGREATRHAHPRHLQPTSWA